MNGFLVRFSNTESALDHMQQVESEIHSEEEEVSRIRRGFRHEFGGKERILQNLKAQIDKMAALGDHVQTLQTTLSSIMELYAAVEEKLVGSIEIPDTQSQAPSARPDGAEARENGEGRKPASVFDTIHEALKMDESKGVIVGGSLVGAAVLGSAAKGAVLEGDPSARLQAEGFISGTEGENLPGQMENGQEGTAAVCADMDSLTSAVPEFSGDFLKKLSEVSSWDEFLALFPTDTVDQLPEAAKNYLQQLFERFNTGHFPVGDVVFPEMPELLTCGVWGTFFTAVMWYFYLNGNEEAAGALPNEQQQEAELPSETGKEVELPDGRIRTAGKGQIKPLSGENPKDGASAAGDSSKTENAASTGADNSKSSGSGGGHSGSGGGGGHKSSGGGGGGSTGSSLPDYHSSIQGDPSSGASGTQTGAAEAVNTATPEYTAEVNTDATGDYLRTLLGDGNSVTDGLKSWTKSNMTSWGTRAAQKLQNGSSSFSGTSPAGKVAGSLVRAAVVNAGIEIAAHGAGAVSAAAGGGSKDIFEEIE